MTIKTIADETGIPTETVSQLLNNGLKNVSYDMANRCVLVKNFRRYNPGGKPELIKTSIKNDYLVTCNTPLWEIFTKNYPEFSSVIPTVTQPLLNSCGEIPCSGKGKGSSKGKGKGSGNNTTTADENEENVFKIYQNNFGMITSPFIVEELKDISKTYPQGWFEKAVKEGFLSCKGGKPNLKYIQKILERWTNDGISERNPNTTQGKGERDYTGGEYGKLATVSE
jgi:DnaD/phage-associated family protein